MDLKKQRINDVIKATKELKKYEEQLESLNEKQGDIESSLPNLREVVEKTEREKSEILDQFCEDKCSQDDVSKAQKNYDEAVLDEKQANEILQVLTKKIHDLNAIIHDAKERKGRTESLLWNEISDQENEILRKKMGDMILRCYAINRQRNRPLSRIEFLQNVIFTQRDEYRLKELNPEIYALFQKTLNG